MSSNYIIKKNADDKEVKVIVYTKSASAIIPYKGGYLLQKRMHDPYGGFWSLAGGKADGNETPEENCIREVKEETGLDVKIDFKVKTDIEYGIYLGVECTYESTCFAVQVVGGELKLQEDEVLDSGIFSLDEAIKMDLAFKHNMMLETYNSIIYDMKCEIAKAYKETLVANSKFNALINGHKHIIVPSDPDFFEQLKKDKWSSTGALCTICDNHFCGFNLIWYCPKSPTGLCNYEHLNGHYNEDDCIYCHMPYERK
jgi:8-oxo-dGTP pyrophosphatase MutT (NUDIX family)